ncbi:MAG: PAS domain-containing protein [Fulvivirga sp.]|uniref:PAS domain-containing protein n=1 Tax=Fulvivirga sp. TaxID=1931237 RepID=UPI0032EED087
MGEKKAEIMDKLIKVSPISIEIISLKSKQLICDNGWTAGNLGYEKSEFQELSKNLFEKIVHPDDRAVQLEAYASFFDQHEKLDFQDFTIRVLKKDGTYNHLQIRIAPLERDDAGTPLTFLSTVMDVTDLIKLNSRIADQVKIMDEISFKNNHELRAPVATILGLINLIDHEDFSNAHIRELIDSLKCAVKRLDKVIGDINEATYR